MKIVDGKTGTKLAPALYVALFCGIVGLYVSVPNSTTAVKLHKAVAGQRLETAERDNRVIYNAVVPDPVRPSLPHHWFLLTILIGVPDR